MHAPNARPPMLLGLLSVVVLSLAAGTPRDGCCQAPGAEPPPARREYMGRRVAQTMHYLGAPWLVRESRDREEEPAKLMAALDVRPGQTVCDLGCGNGFYTLKLAERVGPRGRVFAVDIQEEMLTLLAERSQARGLVNIRPVLGGPYDPKLPAGEVDLILLVDVYHEFSYPQLMLAAMRQSLSPRGRVALVEYRAEDRAVPIKPLHKMTQAQCVKEYTANGYKLTGQYDGLPWQHLLFFARDDSPLDATPLKPWAPAAD
ncbi:MAG: class I SAM-dependent methyltransferase [Planctomycetota bacterium]